MIYLREITQTDLPLINQWRHNKEVVDNLCETYRYIHLESEDNWFKNYCNNRSTQIRLAICLSESHQHIGNVYLLNINWVSRNCVFHIFIGETSMQGKGYGLSATRLALEHAFTHQNLERIELSALSYNQAAIALYEKCGFQQEGIARNAAYKNGKYYDVVQMGLLRSEFIAGDTL